MACGKWELGLDHACRPAQRIRDRLARGMSTRVQHPDKEIYNLSSGTANLTIKYLVGCRYGNIRCSDTIGRHSSKQRLHAELHMPSSKLPTDWYRLLSSPGITDSERSACGEILRGLRDRTTSKQITNIKQVKQKSYRHRRIIPKSHRPR